LSFDISRYHFIESDELGQRWISLRERLGAPETTLKAYASDLTTISDGAHLGGGRRTRSHSMGSLSTSAIFARELRDGVNNARSDVASASNQRRSTDE